MKILLSTLTLIFSCSLFAGEILSPSLDPLAQVVPMNNNLGLNFINQVAKEKLSTGENKNIMLSPISYYMALSMAYNGAAGNTIESMAELFGNSMNIQDLNSANRTFLDTLVIAEQPPANSYSPKPPVLGIENSAWSASNQSPGGGRFAFSSEFKDSLVSSYGAEINSLNFKQEGASEIINGWADEKTRGLIPSVINDEQMKNLMWILMNATYLEANWAVPFGPSLNKSLNKFETVGNGIVDVEMISTKSRLLSLSNENMDVVELPFYGTDMAFYIAAPKTMAHFAKMQSSREVWSKDFWPNQFSAFSNGEAQIEKTKLLMPKFSFSYSITMKDGDPLVDALGLGFLFRDNANFARMSTEDSVSTKVGIIKQDTKIELDEKGVKAAAVTLIGGAESTSVNPSPTKNILINKPFYFAIASKKNGALLFVGTVVNPAVAE